MVTRIVVGFLLVCSITGILILDQKFAPWFPMLLVVCVGATQIATREMLNLLGLHDRPTRVFLHLAIAAINLSNWLPHSGFMAPPLHGNPWAMVGSVSLAGFMFLLLLELGLFQLDGKSTDRLARGTLILAYLGVLPAFLIQLRWYPQSTLAEPSLGLLCLGITIVSAKCADIGAYFTGRMFGKHLMSPLISPKKTWEGLAGGLGLSMLAACAWFYFLPSTPVCCLPGAACFGLIIGGIGTLGDLAESMLKRDSGIKDASHLLPGFGGCLDVLDSLLVVGPVAWLFFTR